MKKLLIILLLIFGCESVYIPNDCKGYAGGDAVELWGGCYDVEEITYLDLTNSGLTGEIPVEIGNLTNLTSLWLGWNQSTGENSNQLTGEIPPEIGNLTNLTHLHLSYNQLTGEIPPEIGSLTNLTGLFLNNNQLTGRIPSEIGNLTNLIFLRLNDNQLTGEIPQEVCDLIKSNNLKINYILDGNNLTNTCE